MTFDPKKARALIEPLTGYTPGTWEWHGEYFDDLRPVWWCEMTQGQGYIGWDDDNAKEANAALIAAAPDLHAHLTAALDEIVRLETRISSLDHALDFILADAAWTPKHPACESIINRINALRKGSDQ